MEDGTTASGWIGRKKLFAGAKVCSTEHLSGDDAQRAYETEDNALDDIIQKHFGRGAGRRTANLTVEGVELTADDSLGSL